MRFYIATGLAIALVLTTSSGAALYEADWKTPGDGLLTVDTETGLEWLDITETEGLSYPHILSEYGVGGQFEGFRLATVAETTALAEHAEVAIYPWEYETPAPIGTPTNFTAVTQLQALLGFTYDSGSVRRTRAATSDAWGDLAYATVFNLDAWYNTPWEDLYGSAYHNCVRILLHLDGPLRYYGWALVREQVTGPVISSMSPEGTITWTNISTNCIAVVEEFSPATSGQWAVVHSQPATSLIATAQLAMTNERAWFRAWNTNEVTVPSDMVLIPGGSNSGTNPLASGESYNSTFYPATYSLSVDSFYMARYEVTNDKMVEVLQWAHDQLRIHVSTTSVLNILGNSKELLALDSPYCRITWGESSFGMKEEKGSGYPCVEVTWYGAAAYCNYRSEMEGRTPCYDFSDWSCSFSANGYRLPTNEEWEYAARGGAVSKRFPWGGDIISHSQANYSASSYSYDLSSGSHPSYNSGERPFTSPVGVFPSGKNAYDLFDMAGNVAEWCNDQDPLYGRGVHRGGDWFLNTQYCRVGNRDIVAPFLSAAHIGFRVVLRSDM